MDSARNLLQNIFFDIGMVINRHTSAEWRYTEKKLTHYNIMFVYDGEGVFIRNNEKRIVRSGDFVFYRSGDSRSISTNPDRLLKCYGVNFTYTVPIFSNSTGEWSLEHEELPIDFITNIKDEYICEKLMSLFDKLFRVHISGIGLKNQEERKIFVDILDLYFFSVKKDNDINYANKIRIESIIHYMTVHFAERISVEELAAQSGVSVSYFVRIFKGITNQTPITYLNNIRMNKAKQLLADGCSVMETAEMTGFSDIYYFSRTFKKYVGVSPSLYASTPMPGGSIDINKRRNKN